DRAVELAALAGLADQHDLDAFDLLPDLLGFGFALEVLGFELDALGLEIGEVFLGRPHRLFLRQEEVARVTRLHLDDLAHLAKLVDALQQDQFNHWCFLQNGSGGGAARTRFRTGRGSRWPRAASRTTRQRRKRRSIAAADAAAAAPPGARRQDRRGRTAPAARSSC